jgi:tRNA dimethylallyltransferase
VKILVSIVGPTASGKTDLAIRLAKVLGCAVISADSRQIFCKMNIGTAKPTVEEMQGVKHYCIDELNPDEVCNAVWFGRRVEDILSEEFAQRDVMILAGGSGLYLHAVWKGFDEIPPVPVEVRDELLRELEEKGLQALVAELAQADPESHDNMDLQNPQRVIRVLEVFRHTGIPISAYRKGSAPAASGIRHLIFGIDLPRETLYDRINRRVDAMMQAGLLQEVISLRDQFGEQCPALQTVGYRELIFQQKGETDRSKYPDWWPQPATLKFSPAATLHEAVDLVKRNTRRLAKRQMTWFRRYPEVVWLPAGPPEAMIAAIEAKIKSLHAEAT